MIERSFQRVNELPPYVFNLLAKIKTQLLQEGEDVFEFGMGNPDQPTPQFIVDALIQATNDPDADRYADPRGIIDLRRALSEWYQARFDVNLSPESEVLVTMGSKDGLAHLALALTAKGEHVLVPTPAYPIHQYGFVLSGATVHCYEVSHDQAATLANIKAQLAALPTPPKVLLLNFPSNPTAACVDLEFYEAAVALAKEYGFYIIQDFAYADLCFEGYKAPSILQVPDAKSLAVETYTLSKSYNMPGWRVGFVSGNEELISALARVKSYIDYGLYTPIQFAAAVALRSDLTVTQQISDVYLKRRDVLCDALNKIGWEVETPKASMFVWAKLPQAYRYMSSLEFSQLLLKQAHVVVAPGSGFGGEGEGYVRFSLVESESRIEQAVSRIEQFFKQKVSTLEPKEAVSETLKRSQQ